MKKSLIALAALAVVGAASAQSSVTLYGRLDLGMSHNKTTISNAGGSTSATATSLAGAQNVRTGSRLGVKGTEDLGGGLKANFTIETNVNPDASASTFGRTRQAHLSLVGGFGGVVIGTFMNSLDDIRSYSASVGGVAGGDFLNKGHNGDNNNQGATNYGSFGLAGRSENAIAYRMVSNGFNLGLGTTYEKGANNSKTRGYIGHIGYDNGPLSTKLGLGQGKAEAPGVNAKLSDWAFAVSYDLGMAVPYFQYENTKFTGATPLPGLNAEVKTRSYELGAKFPMGAFTPYVTLSSGKITRNQAAFGPNQDSKARAFQIGTTYDLSKRTYAYFALGQEKLSRAGTDTKNNGYALGLVHSF